MKLWMVLVLVVACNKDTTATGTGSGSGSGSGSAPRVAAGSGSAVATPPPAVDWKAGDVVQIQSLKDQRWYEAQIVNAGATYKVLYTYADTVEENVDKARMRRSVWHKKDVIEGQVNGAWKQGTIALFHPDTNTYDVTFPEGETKGMVATSVRGIRKPKQSGGGGRSTSSNAAAPCPGPGLTRRCSGVCVNIQEDNNNCGSCGNQCRSGYHCDGHMFCRDASGNL